MYICLAYTGWQNICGDCFHLKKKITFEKDNIKFGLLLFLIGFIKKVYFADNIGLIIDPIFADSGEASEKDLIKGFLLFPLQV